MGRNAKRKAHRAFVPEVADADLRLELIGIPTDGDPAGPILVIEPQTDLGSDWFSPDRQSHFHSIEPADSVVFNVVRDAVLDGLVVVLSLEGQPPQVHWSSRAAWRTRNPQPIPPAESE